ncbi:MAG: hypothetical protein OXF77_00365 [Thaumarchaeota archaeon]|nr:hypothetical protein [Nitrososphaerota archaeon]
MFCAGVTAYKAVKTTNPKPNSTLGIFGIGGIGHIAIQFASISRCKVFAITRSALHMSISKKLNAYNIIKYTNQSTFIKELKEIEGYLIMQLCLRHQVKL